MRFEGFYQILCEEGHYHTYNIFGSIDPIDDPNWRCDICNKKISWWNLVDQTNGVAPTKDDSTFVKLQIKGIDKELCSTCGHEHHISPTTHYVPKNKGHKIQ